MSIFQDEVRTALSPANIVTLLALNCGAASVWALWVLNNEAACLYLLTLAICFDYLDGFVARKLKAESRLGAALDAICDTVNFGVVPILLVSYKIDAVTGPILLGMLAYLSALVIRLAIFLTNSLSDEHSGPPSRYFRGVPAPAAAILIVAPYFTQASRIFDPGLQVMHFLIVATLCLSMMPTPSLKYRKLTSLLVLAFIGAAAVGFLFNGLAGAFLFIALTYLVSVAVTHLLLKFGLLAAPESH